MLNDKIIFELDIDYNKYRENLIKGIITELDKIFNIFNDDNNTTIIMLFIINKKIIEEENKYLINILKDLVESLNNIINKNIDQKEYLEIILKILNLTAVIDKIELLINKMNVDMNINKFINDLKELIENIKKNNILFLKLLDIITLQKNIEKLKNEEMTNEENIEDIVEDEYKIKKHDDEINKIVIDISRMLVKDYFIYYNPREMLEYLYNNTRIENYNYIPYTILKRNEIFQQTYLLNYTKYMESYSNEKNKIAKCRYIIKNKKFENLINEMNNLKYVNSVDSYQP